jgi:hypothetical protein
MLTRTLLIAGFAIGVCSTATAQDYFDFGQIQGVPDKPAIQVDLNPMMLGLIGATAGGANPAAADLLKSIDGVRVRIYTNLENADEVVGFVDGLSNRLESADWQRLVTVEDGSQVRVYLQGTEELVTGVTAMVVYEGQAIFINVAGSISGEQLAQSVASLSQSGFNPGAMLGALGTVPGLTAPVE